MACQAQERWDQEVKFFRYTPQQNGLRGWLLVHGVLVREISTSFLSSSTTRTRVASLTLQHDGLPLNKPCKSRTGLSTKRGSTQTPTSPSMLSGLRLCCGVVYMNEFPVPFRVADDVVRTGAGYSTWLRIAHRSSHRTCFTSRFSSARLSFPFRVLEGMHFVELFWTVTQLSLRAVRSVIDVS